jgi:hypothetical protein
MTTAVDCPLSVHNSQAFVVSGDEGPDPVRAISGQANGLCGARVPGALFLVTGRNTGKVGFRVEITEGPPPLEDRWEEVVGVSFTPTSAEVSLMDWHERMYPLPLAEPASYRVRYCARGMDAGKTTIEDKIVDFYELTFWPAPAEPDRLVRQTSRIATHWHEEGFTRSGG